MARLHIKSGPRAGERIEVEQEMVIGRVGADLTIEDAELSSRHLVVRPLGDALEVDDLGSANGTFVEGARIKAPTRLGSGAVIKLGTTVLEVEAEVGGSQPTTGDDLIADPNATRIHNVALDALPPAPGAPATDGAAAGAAAAPARAGEPRTAPVPAASFGSFAPPAPRRRGRGLASRSWVPVALSFGSVITTAVALVIYFAAR